MTGYDVVTFGEAMASLHGPGPLRMGGDLTLSVAGAEANVAIGLARLGHQVRWAGVLGDDELGRLILRTLRAEAVDVTACRLDPSRPTGLLLQERRIGDIIRVHYYRAGSAGSALTSADATRALGSASIRVLHVTGITPALGPEPAAAVVRAVRLAAERGVRVCLDVNYRAKLWNREDAAAGLRPLLPYVNVLVASEDELPLVAESPEAALAAGPGEVVVKLGGDGAEVWTEGGHVREPAVPVQVVNPVGAGDAFVAGYLSGLLDGLPVAERLRRGVVLGAFAVASHGDWHGLPDRAELSLLALPGGETVR